MPVVILLQRFERTSQDREDRTGGCQQEVKMSEKKKESEEVGRLRDL